MFGVGVAFYVDVCIVFHRRLNILPYPTWGWCLGIASSLVWLLAAGLWLGEHMYGCESLGVIRCITEGTSCHHVSVFCLQLSCLPSWHHECGGCLLAAQSHLRLQG